jgi:monoterpene epsilon-lactone hydrolase
MDAMRAEQQALAGRPPPTVAEQRASYERIAEIWPVPGDVSIVAVEVAGRPAEWVAAPGARDDRAVLYLHGGDYVIGGLATHRDLAARISRASASRVLLLDYRLAPEHRFPAAGEDALGAYRWLLAQGHDPRRLSPWTDLALSGDSMRSRASADPAIDRATLERWAEHYLAGGDPRQPLASPLYADLSGLPALLLLVGTAEILLDDAARVAQKAAAAGVEVVYERWPDLGHVFAAYVGTPEAGQAAALIATFLASHWT